MATDVQTIFERSTTLFAQDPGAALFTVSVGSDLVGATEVAVRMGDKVATVDEPEVLGGGGVAPNPVQFALASLGSCQAITYRFGSERMGIRIDHLAVEVQGDIDLRGLFGVSDGVRPGFGGVDVRVKISGPETPERYEALRRAVDDHCPVLDVFTNEVTVQTSVAVG
jgi:uncharacterized OsmC-like protein